MINCTFYLFSSRWNISLSSINRILIMSVKQLLSFKSVASEGSCSCSLTDLRTSDALMEQPPPFLSDNQCPFCKVIFLNRYQILLKCLDSFFFFLLPLDGFSSRALSPSSLSQLFTFFFFSSFSLNNAYLYCSCVSSSSHRKLMPSVKT